MRDMNFFSVYKKRRAKRKGLRIFLIVFIVLLLLINGAIIGGGLWYFNELEKEIENKRAWINDPATVEAIREAEQLKIEVDLTNEYLDLLKSAANELKLMNIINSQLMDEIRMLTPPTTFFTNSEYIGNGISLQCVSTETTDAMDMYHALLNSQLFSQVNMSGFTVNEEGAITFSVSMVLKGGALE